MSVMHTENVAGGANWEFPKCKGGHSEYNVQGCIQDFFFQGGANLEYVKKRGGEAVRSCRAAAGGWV